MISLRSGVKLDLMKKNNFNLDIFFKELSSNSLDLIDIMEKANGNKDVVWDGDKELGRSMGYEEGDVIHFNPNYFSPELIFPFLDSSLSSTPIFICSSAKDNPRDVVLEYGYIYSSEKEESFLFLFSGHDVNNDDTTVKKFDRRLKKEEFNNFPNLVLDHFKTTLTSKTIAPHNIYINGDYQWDLNYLAKVLDKSLKEKRKQVEVLKKMGIKDYDHSIYIKTMAGKKSTTVKVLK